MIELNSLSLREQQVARLLAWGASKKEVADKLNISIHTVENHSRTIYSKINCQSASELSAWWFCTKYDVPVSDAPRKSKVFALIFLLISILGIFAEQNDEFVRVRSSRTTSRVSRPSRGNKQNLKII